MVGTHLFKIKKESYIIYMGIFCKGKERLTLEIERINENTIKLYISYLDIEDRGFDREEIWFNREKSEQLFWQMMEEIKEQEDFVIEGPLWIQVQALEKGLEIVVTEGKIDQHKRARLLSKDNEEIILPENISDLLEDHFGPNQEKEDAEIKTDDWYFTIIVHCNEFEDVIQLSHYVTFDEETTEDILYSYENEYYLMIKLNMVELDEEDQENIISQVLEFSEEDTSVTLHLLEEYGTRIFEENALKQVASYFHIYVMTFIYCLKYQI